MNIKSVKLTNFKPFKASKFYFDPMTLIKGKIGSGKTTIALEAPLFCYFGYTPKELLSDLSTKWIKSKSYAVEIESQHGEDIYTIERQFPIKIIIKKNNKLQKFSSNIEAQRFINKLIGDRNYFQKFRIIDKAKEANVLEQGNVTLKKIMFTGSDEIFNNIRVKLNSLKHEREIWNKDNVHIFTHYPSSKRLQLISNKLNELDVQETEMIHGIREFEREQNIIEREMGRLEANKGTIKRRRDMILANKKCYACNQGISESLQKSILSEISQETVKINNSIASKTPELENLKDIINSQRNIRENISSHIHTLGDLKTKLQARLKLKDYKYSSRDVLIVKKAIAELDRLSSYYLTETVRTLEPIINSILQKINFTLSFDVNIKGKFIINLEKNNIIYKYKDLSCGQQLMLQIAFKLALLLQNNDTGIVIADEGFTNLDEESLLHILQIFEGLPFQLVMCLHRFDEIPDNVKIIDLNEKK